MNITQLQQRVLLNTSNLKRQHALNIRRQAIFYLGTVSFLTTNDMALIEQRHKKTTSTCHFFVRKQPQFFKDETMCRMKYKLHMTCLLVKGE